MPDFTIEGRRIQSLPDVQRSWMWEVVFPNIAGFLPEVGTSELEDDLTIRARTVSIPGRGMETITSNFMGMAQLFQGRPTFTRSVSMQFEETENQLVSKFLYAWNQALFNVESGNENAGVARENTKRELTRTIYLNMYNSGGGNDHILEKRIKFFNAWPSNFNDVILNYTTSDSVKYDVTFSYDFWTLENN